ncbi:hypothetical protein Ga0466249_002540 [Sporomusaceae bacterium BoRhaA]|nr:hypothetical protein [Pelorhabdus rhamnosifermentans]
MKQAYSYTEWNRKTLKIFLKKRVLGLISETRAFNLLGWILYQMF